MARIDISTIERRDKKRNTLHDKVDTTYTVFVQGGTKYIQFDTYGSASRKLLSSVSQSFQLDREAAQFIVDLLSKEFLLK